MPQLDFLFYFILAVCVFTLALICLSIVILVVNQLCSMIVGTQYKIKLLSRLAWMLGTAAVSSSNSVYSSIIGVLFGVVGTVLSVFIRLGPAVTNSKFLSTNNRLYLVVNSIILRSLFTGKARVFNSPQCSYAMVVFVGNGFTVFASACDLFKLICVSFIYYLGPLFLFYSLIKIVTSFYQFLKSKTVVEDTKLFLSVCFYPQIAVICLLAVLLVNTFSYLFFGTISNTVTLFSPFVIKILVIYICIGFCILKYVPEPSRHSLLFWLQYLVLAIIVYY